MEQQESNEGSSAKIISLIPKQFFSEEFLYSLSKICTYTNETSQASQDKAEEPKNIFLKESSTCNDENHVAGCSWTSVLRETKLSEFVDNSSDSSSKELFHGLSYINKNDACVQEELENVYLKDPSTCNDENLVSETKFSEFLENSSGVSSKELLNNLSIININKNDASVCVQNKTEELENMYLYETSTCNNGNLVTGCSWSSNFPGTKLPQFFDNLSVSYSKEFTSLSDTNNNETSVLSQTKTEKLENILLKEPCDNANLITGCSFGTGVLNETELGKFVDNLSGNCEQDLFNSNCAVIYKAPNDVVSSKLTEQEITANSITSSFSEERSCKDLFSEESLLSPVLHANLSLKSSTFCSQKDNWTHDFDCRSLKSTITSEINQTEIDIETTNNLSLQVVPYNETDQCIFDEKLEDESLCIMIEENERGTNDTECPQELELIYPSVTGQFTTYPEYIPKDDGDYLSCDNTVSAPMPPSNYSFSNECSHNSCYESESTPKLLEIDQPNLTRFFPVTNVSDINKFNFSDSGTCNSNTYTGSINDDTSKFVPMQPQNNIYTEGNLPQEETTCDLEKWRFFRSPKLSFTAYEEAAKTQNEFQNTDSSEFQNNNSVMNETKLSCVTKYQEDIDAAVWNCFRSSHGNQSFERDNTYSVPMPSGNYSFSNECSHYSSFESEPAPEYHVVDEANSTFLSLTSDSDIKEYNFTDYETSNLNKYDINYEISKFEHIEGNAQQEEIISHKIDVEKWRFFSSYGSSTVDEEATTTQDEFQKIKNTDSSDFVTNEQEPTCVMQQYPREREDIEATGWNRFRSNQHEQDLHKTVTDIWKKRDYYNPKKNLSISNYRYKRIQKTRGDVIVKDKVCLKRKVTDTNDMYPNKLAKLYPATFLEDLEVERLKDEFKIIRKKIKEEHKMKQQQLLSNHKYYLNMLMQQADNVKIKKRCRESSSADDTCTINNAIEDLNTYLSSGCDKLRLCKDHILSNANRVYTEVITKTLQCKSEIENVCVFYKGLGKEFDATLVDEEDVNKLLEADQLILTYKYIYTQ